MQYTDVMEWCRMGSGDVLEAAHPLSSILFPLTSVKQRKALVVKDYGYHYPTFK
jgi:hypothetical protein